MRGALFGLALSFVIGAFACLAIKPLRVDGGSTPAPEPDADPTCVACLKAGDEPGPGCKTEYDACQAAAECAQSFTCALADGCFASASKVGIWNSLSSAPPGDQPAKNKLSSVTDGEEQHAEGIPASDHASAPVLRS